MRERRGRHDPGRVVRDLAVMLADVARLAFHAHRATLRLQRTWP